MGAPAHSPTPSYPGKSQRPALPPACFSLQYKEDRRLSCSPGSEQGRIQFPYLPHFLAGHQKWVANPSSEEGPSNTTGRHICLCLSSVGPWQRHYNTKLLGSHCSQGRCLQAWPQAGPPTSQVSPECPLPGTVPTRPTAAALTGSDPSPAERNLAASSVPVQDSGG